MSASPRKVKKIYIWLSIGLVLAAGAALGIWALREAWYRPLAPGLELPTVTLSPQPSSTLASTTPPEAEIQETVSPAASNTPEPRTLCGGPETMLILALGADTRTDDYYYGLADVIRIARVDFVTPKLTVLSLPRDLWVRIPDISEKSGLTHGKLNEAYTYGNPGLGYYSGPGAGPGLMARTIEANFGLRVEHYAALNMRTFVDVIDAVGGVDIHLDKPVDGRPIGGVGSDFGYYPAGDHHFDGETALKFSRIRKVDTVFDRMDRQTQVLCALRKKLLTPDIIGDIPELILAFRGRVLTDLSLGQMSQLACLALKLDRENIVFTSLPRDLFTASFNTYGAFIWETDFDVIRDYVAQFQAGTWPTEPSGPSCQ